MINIAIFVTEDSELTRKTASRLFSAAKKLSEISQSEVTLTVLCRGKTENLNIPSWVSRVFKITWTGGYSTLAETLSRLVTTEGVKVLLAPHNTLFKELLAQVAGRLNLPMISDVTEIHDDLTFTKQTYSGSVSTRYRVLNESFFITIRTNLFSPYQGQTISKEPDITISAEGGIDEILEVRESKSDRPDLQTASVVVSGGRALGSRESFESIIFPLADKLKAAIGATRAAVDSGYAPNEWQVGQTGKSVAPDVYIAVGVSGAVQHIAGIKDSKFIAVINKDQSAPIYDHSDLFLVADLFEAVPEILRKL